MMNRDDDTRPTWIAHVDLDAFFASCEVLEQPDYRGRPVVVGAMPGKRGVVAAASYEAREYGIHSAMPISEAYRRCPDAVYLRPNMPHYQSKSRQVFDVIREVAPVVEKASIDEAYLDISGLERLLGSPHEIGRRLRERVLATTRLTISVGMGPNRLIAKLASEACKPDGLKVVAVDDVANFLGPMPISNLRGLGRRTLPILQRMGIRTVAQLRDTPFSKLAEHLGDRAAANFQHQACGIGSAQVTVQRGRKSLSKETTFGDDVSDRRKLHDTLRQLSAGVARSLRREGLAARVVTLKIRYRGFETHTRQTKLGTATHDERVLLATSQALLDKGDLPNKPVRLIGVGVSDWAVEGAGQRDLFVANDEHNTDETILSTIDTVTEKFGKPLLQVGLSRKR